MLLAAPLLVNNYFNRYFNKYSLMIRQFIDVTGGHKHAYIYDNYTALNIALYRRSGPGKHLVFTGQIYRASSIKKRSFPQ